MIPADSAEKTPMLSEPMMRLEDVRSQEVQAEEPEDDGRDPGDRLEHRLDDVAHPWAGVLREEDGAQEAERDRDDHGDHGDEHRAADQGQDAEGVRLDGRRPLGPGEEVDRVDLLEELEGLEREDERRSPIGGEDAEDRRQEQERLDDPFADRPLPGQRAGRRQPSERASRQVGVIRLTNHEAERRTGPIRASGRCVAGGGGKAGYWTAAAQAASVAAFTSAGAAT